MKKLAAVPVLLIALALPLQVMAHGGHTHKVMGTVTAVDSGSVELETVDGEQVSAHLSDETKYFKGDAAATFADLKVGIRAVLSLADEDGKKTAREVRLPPEKDGESGS